MNRNVKTATVVLERVSECWNCFLLVQRSKPVLTDQIWKPTLQPEMVHRMYRLTFVVPFVKK